MFKVMLLNLKVAPLPLMVWLPFLPKVTLQISVDPPWDMSNLPLLVRSPPMLRLCVAVPDAWVMKVPPLLIVTLPATVTLRTVLSKVNTPLAPCPTVIDAAEASVSMVTVCPSAMTTSSLLVGTWLHDHVAAVFQLPLPVEVQVSAIAGVGSTNRAKTARAISGHRYV
jgi:hypothetical protein